MGEDAPGSYERTGDLFAIPLTIAMAIGRLGCFFGGIEDHTYGTPSTLPWSVDFGDGLPRHPTQLYEIAFLLALAGVLFALRRAPLRNGDLYRIFLTSYLAWRFVIDFWKRNRPSPVYRPSSGFAWRAYSGTRGTSPACYGSKRKSYAHG